MESINVASYKDARHLIADLRKIGRLTHASARQLLLDLDNEGRRDWFPLILSEAAGASAGDALLEAGLFHYPTSLSGEAGVVKILFSVGSIAVEVLACKIVPHKEGLVLLPSALHRSSYSEDVSRRCFDVLIEVMLELDPVKAILKGGSLVVKDETFSFLNGLEIGHTMSIVDRALGIIKKDQQLTLSFKRSSQGVLIVAELQDQVERLSANPIWAKISKIKNAGVQASLTLSPAIAPRQPETVEAPEKPPHALAAEAMIKDELMFLAQGFEYMRSLEVSEIRQGRGSARLVNNSMKIVDHIQNAVTILHHGSPDKAWVEDQVRAILAMMNQKFSGTHDLTIRQIEQIPLKQRRLADAFITYCEMIKPPKVDSEAGA